MKATVTLFDSVNLNVEYDFTITTHGSPESWSSYGGDPAESAEFDIEVLGISLTKPGTRVDLELDLPNWLKVILAEHLHDRDDINAIVQQADQDGETDFGADDSYL